MTILRVYASRPPPFASIHDGLRALVLPGSDDVRQPHSLESRRPLWPNAQREVTRFTRFVRSTPTVWRTIRGASHRLPAVVSRRSRVSRDDCCGRSTPIRPVDADGRGDEGDAIASLAWQRTARNDRENCEDREEWSRDLGSAPSSRDRARFRRADVSGRVASPARSSQQALSRLSRGRGRRGTIRENCKDRGEWSRDLGSAPSSRDGRADDSGRVESAGALASCRVACPQ